MSKVTLVDVANLEAETTAIATMTANNTTIETAFDNTLSLDGSTPNSMGAPLDMNSYRIINLAAPDGANDAVRLQDIDGSTVIGTYTATGGTARSFNSKLADILSVRDFGAVGDGSTDDYAAIAAAITATTAGIIYFPPGTYKVSQTVLVNKSNVSLIGAGQGISTIKCSFDAGDIICIGDGVTNPNNNQISNMSITSSIAKTSGAAIRFRNGHNLRSQNIRMDSNLWVGYTLDGGSGQYMYWVSDFEINSGHQGIVIGGSSDSPQEMFIRYGEIANTDNEAIIWTSGGGLYMDHVSTINCGKGLATFPPAGKTCTSAFFTNCLMDTADGVGWNLIENGGTTAQLYLVGCWASTCGNVDGVSSGYHIAQSAGTVKAISMTGCHASNCAGSGVSISLATNVSISNTHTLSNSTAGSASYAGIDVAANTTDFTITGGISGGGGYFAGNNQSYGVKVAAGTSDRYSIIGIQTPSNVSGNISDGGTGVNKMIVTQGKSLGYSIGQGGTVTQGTSRTTGVTLNEPSGQITMFSAAGSATPAKFTVTNSIVASTDTIILSQKSSTTNVYNYTVSNNVGSAFDINFWTTGGTATDAPVISFTVLKGASS